MAFARGPVFQHEGALASVEGADDRLVFTLGFATFELDRVFERELAS
jgi:hypothetical protein